MWSCVSIKVRDVNECSKKIKNDEIRKKVKEKGRKEEEGRYRNGSKCTKERK
jgi:hypothetical protein